MKSVGLSIVRASPIAAETGSRNGVQTPECVYISLPMNAAASQLISRLGLSPLPREGGFYAVTWKSAAQGPGGRASGSAILFLMTETDFSALHRLRTDEIWHYHAGDPAEVVRLDPRTRACSVSLLGPDVAGSHAPQAIVPAGEWQGARIRAGEPAHGWTLFGCTLSPAWDEREFELGDREGLLREFPDHTAIIRSLTR
jgi:predicted cupin superfamily sugar epimerase